MSHSPVITRRIEAMTQTHQQSNIQMNNLLQKSIKKQKLTSALFCDDCCACAAVSLCARRCTENASKLNKERTCCANRNLWPTKHRATSKLFLFVFLNENQAMWHAIVHWGRVAVNSDARLLWHICAEKCPNHNLPCERRCRGRVAFSTKPSAANRLL